MYFNHLLFHLTFISFASTFNFSQSQYSHKPPFFLYAKVNNTRLASFRSPYISITKETYQHTPNSKERKLTAFFSGNPKLSPIFYGQIYKGGADYTIASMSVYRYGWGIKTRYDSDNISIQSEFINHTFIGLTSKPYSFSSQQGLSQFVGWPYSDAKSVFDARVSNMIFTYNKSDFNLQIGKYDRVLGPGISSIIISKKSPSFPQLGFSWQINNKIKFEYFVGILRSLIKDNIATEYYNNPITSRNVQVKRSISAHRVEISLFPNIQLSFTESMIYARRDFEVHYFPFIAFWPMKNYIGDLDNMQISVDLVWQPNYKSKLYSVVFIDEMDPRGILTNPLSIFRKENENWWAWQLGTSYKDLLVGCDEIRIEYSWLDHRVYRNKISINDYYHYGYPLGFWAGPHSEELYIDYTFNMFNSQFRFSYSNARRGHLTQKMLIDAYNDVYHNRYEGDTENKVEIELSVEKEVFSNFYLNFGIQYLDWENPNFDLYDDGASEVLQSPLKKGTISIGFTYGFSQMKLRNRN